VLCHGGANPLGGGGLTLAPALPAGDFGPVTGGTDLQCVFGYTLDDGFTPCDSMMASTMALLIEPFGVADQGNGTALAFVWAGLNTDLPGGPVGKSDVWECGEGVQEKWRALFIEANGPPNAAVFAALGYPDPASFHAARLLPSPYCETLWYDRSTDTLLIARSVSGATEWDDASVFQQIDGVPPTTVTQVWNGTAVVPVGGGGAPAIPASPVWQRGVTSSPGRIVIAPDGSGGSITFAKPDANGVDSSAALVGLTSFTLHGAGGKSKAYTTVTMSVDNVSYTAFYPTVDGAGDADAFAMGEYITLVPQTAELDAAERTARAKQRRKKK
jgi:hypothetical protein